VSGGGRKQGVDAVLGIDHVLEVADPDRQLGGAMPVANPDRN
jgi:hypothetical protein